MTNRTARAWCFTSYAEELPVEFPDTVRYLIVQRERCETTGKLHWQGYVELTTPMKMGGVKKVLQDPAAHLGQRKGTREQARGYCTRDKNGDLEKQKTVILDVPIFEFGKWTGGGQGKRNDLADACALIESGEGLKRVAEEYAPVFVKYHRGLQALATTLEDDIPAERDIRVEVWIGKTGTGKTQTATRTFPGAYIWTKTADANWFCGYMRSRNKDVIILDDYAGGMNIAMFLRFLDRYPFEDMPTKGGHVSARFTKVIITSNLPVDHWYPSISEEHAAALARRIHNVQTAPPYSWVGWPAAPRVPTPPRKVDPARIDLTTPDYDWDGIASLLDAMGAEDPPCVCGEPGGGGGGGCCGATLCINRRS